MRGRRELGDRPPPVRAAADADGAVGELEVVDARLELPGGELEELPPHLAGGVDDRPSVVERRLAARAAAVVRTGVGVLVA